MSDGIRMYTNFIASIDTRLRNPKWVIEHLTRSKLKGDGTRYVLRVARSPGQPGHKSPSMNHPVGASQASCCL